jgi:hypothetical protein
LAEAEKIGVFFLENLVLDRGMCPSPVLIAVVCRVTFVAWCFFCFVGVLRCVLHFAIASLYGCFLFLGKLLLHQYYIDFLPVAFLKEKTPCKLPVAW